MDEKPTCILCCTDFSDNALRAFDYAVDAARHRPGAKLYLLNVIPEPDSQFWKSYIYQADLDVDQKAKHDIDQRVDSDYRPRVPAGVELISAHRIGRDYEKILEFAREIQADLIVLGRQGSNGSKLRTFFFGNVAERVVCRAACPVLVVPSDARPLLPEPR